MKNKLIIVISLVLLILANTKEVFSQEPSLEEYTLDNDYKFVSIFGVNTHDTLSTIYCVLGNGFFRTKASSDAGLILKNWVKNNPDAKVVPVAASLSPSGKGVAEKFTYVWVVSATDTLNIHLVKQGAYPGGTMIKPRDYSNMKEHKDMDVYENFVSSEEYDLFLKKVKSAEKEAFEAKRGVWLEFEED